MYHVKYISFKLQVLINEIFDEKVNISKLVYLSKNILYTGY